jgi:hypothetical protein
MFRGGASFADAITFGADKIEKKLGMNFLRCGGRRPYITTRREI